MSNLDKRPKALSQQTVTKLAQDENFYKSVPEFNVLKPHVEVLTKAVKQGGCRSCKKRRMEYNVMVAFIQVLSKCPPEALNRFKEYIGASTVQYHGYNQQKGTYELRQF